MLTLYSQVMAEVKCPIPVYKYGHGFCIIWFSLFKLFPVSF